MLNVKSILAATVIAGSFFFLTPSTHTVTNDVTVRSGSTVNQLILDSARQQGIDVDSVDLNESRDLTIHESGVDAGNLKPGSTVTVKVVYRK